jgi:signal transduction histidine kinase
MDRAAPRRMRLPILAKLLVTFTLPTMALFSLFAAVAHEVARRDLEAELGIRLSALAQTAALEIRGKYLTELGPGGEEDRAYLRARRVLESVREATGVARLYVFDRGFASRVDTADTPIGATHFQAELHRHELGRVFERGEAVSSVLFEGTDGKLYKAGYAPVRASESEDEIVLALGVDAPAAYFERLADLRRSLMGYGALLALVVIAIAVVVAALITRPVRRLAAAAERIGKGDLGTPIARTSHDELGFLADTMEDMRREIAARTEKMQLMLSGIAHEVRNPLGGIKLFTGILRDEIEPGDERRRHVDRIERELGYLETVVSEFLDYARRPAPELAEVDLGALLGDVIELVRPEAERAGVALVMEVINTRDAREARDAGDAREARDARDMPGAPGERDAQPVRCRADAGQVRRAALNLVRNAVQASIGVGGVDGPEVRVTVQPAGGQAVLAVHNRGAEIPAEVRARMFEPFFTTREKGTGLGLAFVREIVDDHGGALSVRCESGTTVFEVRLPAA